MALCKYCEVEECADCSKLVCPRCIQQRRCERAACSTCFDEFRCDCDLCVGNLYKYEQH